jgi:hypothetical protein
LFTQIFTTVAQLHSGAVPDNLRAMVAASLPGLLNAIVINLARFLDRRVPQLHERVMESMGTDAYHKHFAYLAVGSAHILLMRSSCRLALAPGPVTKDTMPPPH